MDHLCRCAQELGHQSHLQAYSFTIVYDQLNENIRFVNKTFSVTLFMMLARVMNYMNCLYMVPSGFTTLFQTQSRFKVSQCVVGGQVRQLS